MTKLVCLVGLLLGVSPVLAQAPARTHLKVGDSAPDFTLPATMGKQFTLSDYRGKSTVVVAFFPAAFTGGCTKELTSFVAEFEKFEAASARVVAISTDNLPTLAHWANEHLKAAYPLASDFMREVSKKYGVLNESRGVASRTTFVVDASGRITDIFEGNDAIDVTQAAGACSRLKPQAP